MDLIKSNRMGILGTSTSGIAIRPLTCNAISDVFSCEASLSSCNLTDSQTDSQLAIFNFAVTYRPPMKKFVLQNVSHFYQRVHN